ncbi:hypothetical protein L4C34_04370 [Vibrio profundum]|uniref:hypothetical protein n=1 Tax=Vibrio profundum TaxID=2910247 RepID=UPI003D133E7D
MKKLLASAALTLLCSSSAFAFGLPSAAPNLDSSLSAFTHAKENGNTKDACSSASLIIKAYELKGDSSNVQKWKSTKSELCMGQ